MAVNPDQSVKKTRDPVEWALAIQAEYERAEREDDEFRTENTRPIPPGESVTPR